MTAQEEIQTKSSDDSPDETLQEDNTALREECETLRTDLDNLRDTYDKLVQAGDNLQDMYDQVRYLTSYLYSPSLP